MERVQYLLRYQSEIDGYRESCAAFIEKYGEQYRDWFGRLPMFQWVPLPYMNDKTARLVIGLLCILYLDGVINLNFNSAVTHVYRCPLNQAEFQAFIKSNHKNPVKK